MRAFASRWRTMCGAVALTLWCTLLAGSVVAADDDDDATADPAIPPGEERLIASMLGRGALVRDCKLKSGGVQYTVIRATYSCPRGEVTLELGHALSATASSAQTGQFAVKVQSGSPPPGFEDALVSRIRSGESNFAWIWPERPPVENGDAGDGAE